MNFLIFRRARFRSGFRFASMKSLHPRRIRVGAIATPDRHAFADGDLLRGTPKEYAAAGSSYVAYSGRFLERAYGTGPPVAGSKSGHRNHRAEAPDAQPTSRTVPRGPRRRRRRILCRLFLAELDALGELTQDNVFWHNALEQTAQVALRAFGWDLGTIARSRAASPICCAAGGRRASHNQAAA